MDFQMLTDLQWQVLEPFFPKPIKRGRGKPHTAWREVMNSILYVLTTHSKWSSLPRYPGFATKSAAHRWYKAWMANGFLDQVLAKLRDLSVVTGDLKFPPVRNTKKREESVSIAVNY
ncbi:MAG: transposase [Chlamydiae bacterium CG10_big_fil_rev_8_21_14_0_10_42_34]|nr:MAG: transposase [Chlamydiae bacterium CG10_big_fil_rev_8_21_14_0_10_42_34]